MKLNSLDIIQLREFYKDIQTVNVSSSAYSRLNDLLNKLDTESLQEVSNADINIVSELAAKKLKNEKYD